MDEKILIVDDVEENRLILEEIISGMGYRPIMADDAQLALELVSEHSPQLVLTDISMPGMDGYELCRNLKGNEKTKQIPVIFISAYDRPEDIVEGLLLGGADYITKPFTAEVVEARVAVHMRIDKERRELLEQNRHLQVSVNEQLRQLEEEKKNILYALVNIAAQNSNKDKAHIKRVRYNSKILAQGMQLSTQFASKISDSFIDTIELAAPLCDIGNIGIPMEILCKRENLTEEELALRRTHTDIGANLLSDLYVSSDYNDFVATTIDIIRHHHENWDGTGYPAGLSGDDIPLAPQIVAAMEIYCTLTEEYDRETALEMMKKKSGAAVNPDIYEICCKISRQMC